MKGTGSIHPTAILSTRAILGENVSIGPYTIVYDSVFIGANSSIGPGCIIGEPVASYYDNPDYHNSELKIGNNALIRSGTVIYSGSTIGDHFETGHRATIRENTRIGNHVRAGINADIQADCEIGDYTRLHSSVHIGQFSKIGNFVWIFPFTVLTNDPHPPSEKVAGVMIEDFAVVGAHVVLLPGVRVASNSLIGAGSVVYRDVPEGFVMAGNPARKILTVDQLRDQETGESHYPWPERFDRGMPWKGIGFKTWDAKRRKT
jgi:UDP-3-O-[3-hydroxymyristoyl] glucosamine N-acyltransferase